MNKELEKPHGKFEIMGRITFPKEEAKREIERKVAAELPPKPFPWGWAFLTGSLILGLIGCLSTRKRRDG